MYAALECCCSQAYVEGLARDWMELIGNQLPVKRHVLSPTFILRGQHTCVLTPCILRWGQHELTWELLIIKQLRKLAC